MCRRLSSTLAFQAAWQRAQAHGDGWVRRGFVRSPRRDNVTKPCSRQIARRTVASVSLKVGTGLWHHAAVAIRCRSRAGRRAASSVTIENRASRQGVVRVTALSDHWRRAFWRVTSTHQRRTNQATICTGSRARSVQSRSGAHARLYRDLQPNLRLIGEGVRSGHWEARWFEPSAPLSKFEIVTIPRLGLIQGRSCVSMFKRPQEHGKGCRNGPCSLYRTVQMDHRR